jgi:hypothetical protein
MIKTLKDARAAYGNPVKVYECIECGERFSESDECPACGSDNAIYIGLYLEEENYYEESVLDYDLK